MQIVDARNPLSFRSEDLAKYVLELSDAQETEAEEGDQAEGTSAPKPKLQKKNLLLINKSDLLTRKQRCVPLAGSSCGSCH